MISQSKKNVSIATVSLYDIQTINMATKKYLLCKDKEE